MSRGSIPLSLMAASTDDIVRAFASLASRAVFPSVPTPSRIIAMSGTTAIDPSPVTVTSRSAAFAAPNVSSNTAVAMANLFDRHKDMHHQLRRIGFIFLDEHVFGVEAMVIEIIGDGFVSRVHPVVRSAMHEFKRLPGRRLAGRDVALRRIGRRLRNRVRGLELEAGLVSLGVNRHRRSARRDAFLVEIAVQGLERLHQSVEGGVPVGVALE